MIVRKLVVGMFQENSWVAISEESREAVLIDPGEEADRIVELLEKLSATPVRILNTHAHLDHVGAVAALRERYGIPFAIHEGERANLDSLQAQAAAFGLSGFPAPEVDEWIADGDEFRFGSDRLTAVFTPGHTAGGVSFVGEDRVFVGDTLFAGSIGRTDFPGGDFPTLRRSIRERLFSLPPETIVHSGHGPDTTIGGEKAGNPFVGDGADPSVYGF